MMSYIKTVITGYLSITSYQRELLIILCLTAAGCDCLNKNLGDRNVYTCAEPHRIAVANQESQNKGHGVLQPIRCVVAWSAHPRFLWLLRRQWYRIVVGTISLSYGVLRDSLFLLYNWGANKPRQAVIHFTQIESTQWRRSSRLFSSPLGKLTSFLSVEYEEFQSRGAVIAYILNAQQRYRKISTSSWSSVMVLALTRSGNGKRWTKDIIGEV